MLTSEPLGEASNSQEPEEAAPGADRSSAQRFIHIFFMDGVGLGDPDPATNPFVTAHLPNLNGLLGQNWFLNTTGRITTDRASFVPTDANLGVVGRPQSATGQATILTGRNVPQLVGEHFGPKPNAAISSIIREGTLFHDVVKNGGTAALITPYPQRYFDAIDSGRRLLSAIPLAVTDAGIALKTAGDLRAGEAVSPGFTGQGWHEFLGYTDIPILSLHEAGRHIAALAQRYTFSFFEHWPTDRSGHRGSLAEAVEHLETVDAALGGLFADWDENGLLIITSDHGNIEAKDQRQHTRNPVPTILMGPSHAVLAKKIYDLTDIAKIVRAFLGMAG